MKSGNYRLSCIVTLGFTSTGFKLTDSEDVTKKVVAALDYDNGQKLKLIRQKVPWIFQKAAQIFSGVKGSPTYNSFLDGTNTYWKLIYQKPPLNFLSESKSKLIENVTPHSIYRTPNIQPLSL